LSDKAACALQVIRGVNFDWNQCPINVLEDHLQGKNLELTILDDNPVLFLAFKKNGTINFQVLFNYIDHFLRL